MTTTKEWPFISNFDFAFKNEKFIVTFHYGCVCVCVLALAGVWGVMIPDFVLLFHLINSNIINLAPSS